MHRLHQEVVPLPVGGTRGSGLEVDRTFVRRTGGGDGGPRRVVGGLARPDRQQVTGALTLDGHDPGQDPVGRGPRGGCRLGQDRLGDQAVPRRQLSVDGRHQTRVAQFSNPRHQRVVERTTRRGEEEHALAGRLGERIEPTSQRQAKGLPPVRTTELLDDQGVPARHRDDLRDPRPGQRRIQSEHELGSSGRGQRLERDDLETRLLELTGNGRTGRVALAQVATMGVRATRQ